MEFKYVLLSGLAISATFAACTNEELIENNSQINTEDAVSLGEGFTISGAIAQQNSRAVFEEEGTSIKSKWEPNDQIGAAWYAARTGSNTGFLFENSGTKQFASNHPFERVNKEGVVATAEFKTVTNMMAGKYVLYYPYNKNQKAVDSKVVVPMSVNQTMDVNNPLKHMAENLFSYTTKEYTLGGSAAEDFTMEALPVAYKLTFSAAEGARSIVGKQIEKVVVVANEDCFFTEGELSLNGSDYSDISVVYNGASGKKTNTITLNLTGNQDNADYTITAVDDKSTTDVVEGKMAKPLYFLSLPVDDSMISLTFTVITTDGKAYSKDVSSLDGLKAEGGITSKGGKFNYNIELNTYDSEQNGKIYTKTQFEDAWNQAVDKGTGEITLGAPLTIDELTLDAQASNITVNGDLTVGTLNVNDGTLNADKLHAENVTVGQYGDLTVNEIDVENTLTVKGKATLKNATALNTVVAERDSELSLTSTLGANVIGNFSALYGSDVTLSKITLKGESTIEGTVVTTGSNVTFTGKTSVITTGVINANVQTEFAELDNDGKIVASAALTFKGNTANDGVILIKYASTILAGVKFDNNKTLTLNADLENKGTLNLNVNPRTTGSYNIKNVSLGVINAYAKDAAAADADLSVVNNGVVNVELAKTTDELTFTTLTNNNTVNVITGTLKESATNKVTGNGYIDVKANGKVVLDTTAKTYNGTVIITKNNALVANAETKKASYIETIASDATTIIIGNETTLTSDLITAISGKSLNVRANITLDSNLTITSGKSLAIEENVTIKGTGTTSKTISGVSATDFKVENGKNCKIGSNVSLDLKGFTNVYCNETNYGGLVAEGGTISWKTDI